MGKNSADSAVRKKRKILAAFLLLAAAMAAGILLNICIGSVSVSLPEIIKSLSGQMNWGKTADDPVAAASAPHDPCSSIGRRTGIVRLPFADLFP